MNSVHSNLLPNSSKYIRLFHNDLRSMVNMVDEAVLTLDEVELEDVYEEISDHRNIYDTYSFLPGPRSDNYYWHLDYLNYFKRFSLQERAYFQLVESFYLDSVDCLQNLYSFYRVCDFKCWYKFDIFSNEPIMIKIADELYMFTYSEHPDYLTPSSIYNSRNSCERFYYVDERLFIALIIILTEKKNFKFANMGDFIRRIRYVWRINFYACTLARLQPSMVTDEYLYKQYVLRKDNAILFYHPYFQLIYSLKDDIPAFNKILLLMCGDIEANPGPCVFSTLRSNRQIARDAELQIFGFAKSINNLSNVISSGVDFRVNLDNIYSTLESEISSRFPELLFLFINLYRCRKDKVTCCTVLMQFLLGFNFSISVIKSFLNSIYSKFRNFIQWVAEMLGFSNDAQNQASEDDQEVKGFLSSIFGFFVPNAKSFLKNCNIIYTIDKGVRGMESLITKILHYSRQIIDAILFKFCGETTNSFTDELMKWNTRSVDLMQLGKRPLLSNEEIVGELDELLMLGSKYMLILDGCRNRALVNAFKVQYRQLQAFQLRFSKTASPQKMKVPPYVVTLFGASGSGKSQLIPYVLLTLMSQDPNFKASPEKLHDFANKIHYRQTENEFWDSLQNCQDYLCIDDFGQVADRMNNSEYAELIRILNTAPAKAHMSNLFEKGLVELDFKAVILTTNIKDLKTENITHPDAIKRRLEDTVWNVTIKEQYVKYVGKKGHEQRRLDPSKVGNNINLDIYLFQKYDVHTLQEFGKIMDFGEWVEFLKKDYQVHKDNGSLKFTHLNKFINDLIENVKHPPPTPEILAQLQISNPFRRTPTDEVIRVYDALIKFSSELNEYFVFEASTSCARDLYDNFLSLKESDQINYVQKHLASFTILLQKVDNSKDLNEILKEQIHSMGRPSKFQTFLRQVWKVIAVLFECLLGYAIAVGGTYGIGWCIYKLFKSVYGLFTGTKELLIPACIFDYTMINDEQYFRAVDDKVVRDKFPGALNWNLFENYFLIKDSKYLKFRKNVSHTDDVYKYARFLLDLIKFENVSGLESKYDVNVRNRLMNVLELNTVVDNCKISVRTTNMEKYSVTPFSPNKVILETVLGHSNPIVEVALDSNVNSIKNLAVTNQVFIQTLNNSRYENKGLGCFMRGKMMMTFLHLLPAIYQDKFGIVPTTWTNRVDNFCIDPSDVDVHIPSQFNIKHFSFKLSDLKKYEHIFTEEFGCKDIVFLDFSRVLALPIYPDIVKHFVSKYDLNRVNGSSALLVLYDSSATKNILRIPCLSSIDYPVDLVKGNITYGNINGSTFVRDGYQYNAPTQAGDCGSLLFVENNSIQGKIIGFHVSGFSSGIGNSVSCTKEMIESVFDANLQISLDIDLVMDEIEYIPAGVLYIGQVTDEIGQGGTSKITRSLVHNMRDVSPNKPAYLRKITQDGVILDPFKIGIEKYYTFSPYIKEELLNIVDVDFCWFMNKHRVNFNKSLMRVFTLHEAIVGIEGEKYWRSLPMSTSPGFSWPKRGFPGKRYYFQNEEINEEVINRVSERIELAKKSVRKQHLYVCTLKDETRPIEKVNSGKTRVFTVPQLDYVIAVRQYFGGFSTNFLRGRIFNKSLVGINMYSEEAHQLAKSLRKHKNVLTGDFTNWDGSIRADIAWRLLKYINNVYKEFSSDLAIVEDNRVREVLFADLINSIVLIGQRAYLLTHSLPSGHPLTTVINTLYNIFRSFLEYVAILMTKMKPNFDNTNHWRLFVEKMNGFPVDGVVHKFSLKCYLDNVESWFYGDDLVMSVSNEFIEFYNYQTLSLSNHYIGHKYTTSEKEVSIDRLFDEFDRANILKRSFVWNEKFFRYIAPLSKVVIYDIPNWIKKGHDVVEQTLLNIEVAARELTLHNRDDYDSFVNDYRNILGKMGYYPYFQEYELLQSRVLTGEYMEYLF